MTDREMLEVARAATLKAKDHVDLSAYSESGYHAIKYSIDCARDLLLQAEMTIDNAIAALDQAPTTERNT